MQKNSTHLSFHEIEHTADKGLYAEGSSLEEFFSNMAIGMYHVIYDNISKINIQRAKKKKSIVLEEPALSDLLVSWLGEINFIHLVENIYITKIKQIRISKEINKYILRADLTGIDSLPFKIFIKTEIKAVTYHQLKIKKTETGYQGQVIFDV